VERPTPAHRHASDNVFYRAPLERYTACPSAFWPRSVGWRASGRYYADGWSSSFLPTPQTGTRCGSPVISIGASCPSGSAGAKGTCPVNERSCAGGVTFPTIAWPPSPTDTCCTITFCLLIAR
jgi:hypothetical protein